MMKRLLCLALLASLAAGQSANDERRILSVGGRGEPFVEGSKGEPPLTAEAPSKFTLWYSSPFSPLSNQGGNRWVPLSRSEAESEANVGRGLPLRVDWRTGVAGYFGDEKAVDYRGAVDFLTGQFDSLSDEDKPVACGLLAYLYSRLDDRNDEYGRLGEYFEKYGAIGLGFQFLPLASRNTVLRYLRDWQLRYPWVLKMGFVQPGGAAEPATLASPPETVLLGLEMAGDVYYKVTEGEETLKGGQFHRGYNTVSLPAKKLFGQPGAYPLFLEFKAGDLVVRRELVIGVQMDYKGLLGGPANASPSEEFVLEMFFGQELLASSRKTVIRVEDLGLKPPPPTGKYDPFGPGYQNEPRIPYGFPIMAVPQAILEAIKALKKKDEVEPVPPVELKTDMLVPFRRASARGEAIEVKARLSLGLREMRFLSYAQAGRPAAKTP